MPLSLFPPRFLFSVSHYALSVCHRDGESTRIEPKSVKLLPENSDPQVCTAVLCCAARAPVLSIALYPDARGEGGGGILHSRCLWDKALLSSLSPAHARGHITSPTTIALAHTHTCTHVHTRTHAHTRSIYTQTWPADYTVSDHRGLLLDLEFS